MPRKGFAPGLYLLNSSRLLTIHTTCRDGSRRAELVRSCILLPNGQLELTRMGGTVFHHRGSSLIDVRFGATHLKFDEERRRFEVVRP